MLTDLPTIALVCGLIFLVAALYASVGHGGASGYLAVLSFFGWSPAAMSSTALLLNVLVSGLACCEFVRAGHRPPRFSWLLIVTSLPLAFLGGMLQVSSGIYSILLAFALVVAALKLGIGTGNVSTVAVNRPRSASLIVIGGGIGFLSGVVGVGGGIFLSPVAIFRRWATVKSVAALSAVFIFANSLSGLTARLLNNRFVVEPSYAIVIAAFSGGWIGSRLGSRTFDNAALRRILALTLLVAASKLVIDTVLG